MPVDVVDLRAFYTTPAGIVARRLIGRAIDRVWRDATGQRVMGLGFTTPYLGAAGTRAERVCAFMPAAQGVVNWPSAGPSASALIDPAMLPLPDAAFDRVLVVHALETSDEPQELLAEIWRILTPGGRLVCVVPNRRGVWARSDTTPFGHGQPYSRSQLAGLMRQAMFSPESWMEALYVPPLNGRLFLRSAVAWERMGSTLALPFAGVHVIDATKQLYRPVAVRQARRLARLRPALVPAATPAPTPG